jgi:serine/threonine protein kinase
MYSLLTGKPPFNADHDLEIMRQIKIGKFSITGPQWEVITPLAKDLVCKLLTYNPDKRPSAQ